MGAFHWDECFVTGLPVVDEQHRHLVDVVNRLGEMLVQTEEPREGELEKIFQQLTSYTLYHFQEEEKLMVQHRLDQRLISTHRAEHQGFIQEVGHLCHDHGAVSRNEFCPLLNFLCDWLTYHILGSDQIMAKAINDSDKSSPEPDGVKTKKFRDPVTDMLLKALDGLFKQLLERNLALFQLNRSLEERVEERTRELLKANQSLETQAMTDSLTGLPNRRQAMITFRLAWQEAFAHDTPLSCMMIDADGFKAMNDSYGHDAGDEVLRQLACQLGSAVRTDDHVFRLGGDEFLVLCTETPLAGALVLAEKIRAEVNKMRVPAGGGIWCGSVSIGVAVLDPSIHGCEALMSTADQGVYLAKRNGRNCVATVCQTELAPRR